MIARRHFLSLMTASAAVALVRPARAHGPTPQKVSQTITIAASPDAVWKFAGDFGLMSVWHPMVQSSRVSNGNTPGSERELELEKGVLIESLDEYDAKQMLIAWRLSKENVEVMPVSFYSSSMTVKPSGSGSEVEWDARLYRGDTGNFPPDELNDEAAVAAMTAFYKAGLEGLKAKVEKKG
ncbi:SRPBCC family protein [Methyloraptor flagellatus]|jgi:mxaD protein|uniref:SRPBCC family protein n=1 Tax=Methyloraptor flagellatus TaxID=3162530 RepID=A0AAU7X5K8_9HYPH